MSSGDEGSESEMHEGRERERGGEKVRRCEKAETGMQLRGRRGPNEERAKASHSGVREREGARSDERRKNEGDEETRMP